MKHLINRIIGLFKPQETMEDAIKTLLSNGLIDTLAERQTHHMGLLQEKQRKEKEARFLKVYEFKVKTGMEINIDEKASYEFLTKDTK